MFNYFMQAKLLAFLSTLSSVSASKTISFEDYFEAIRTVAMLEWFTLKRTIGNKHPSRKFFETDFSQVLKDLAKAGAMRNDVHSALSDLLKNKKKLKQQYQLQRVKCVDEWMTRSLEKAKHNQIKPDVDMRTAKASYDSE